MVAVVVLDVVVVVLVAVVVVVVVVVMVVVDTLVVVLLTVVVVEETLVVVLLAVVVVVAVVVVELTVVVDVVSTQVEHITGHFDPTNSGKMLHMPAKILQSTGSYSPLHTPSVVVVVAVVPVVDDVEHDPHSTGHCLRSSTDSSWPVHREVETSPQSSGSGLSLHKPVVLVVVVMVVSTQESHLNGQLSLTLGSNSQSLDGMPAQSNGSLMIPLQLGVVVVLVLLVVVVVLVVTEVVVGQTSHSAGHMVCAIKLRGAVGSQSDRVIDTPHSEKGSGSPLHSGAAVVVTQLLHKSGQAPLAVAPRKLPSKQSASLNPLHEVGSCTPLQ